MLEHTMMLCHHVYDASVDEQWDAWRMRGITLTYGQQKAELPDIKEAMPECGEVHPQDLQDVVLRVDRAFQAFFQRSAFGETPGYHSFTYPQIGYHGGARPDNGFLVLSKLRRMAPRWSRLLEGGKTSFWEKHTLREPAQMAG
jgi:putative transposase